MTTQDAGAAITDVEDELNIFISYKSQSELAAVRFKEILEGLFRGDSEERKRLRIFISSEIPKGRKFDDEIHKALRRCDCFILLYTDPGLAWNWSLYESGFFVGRRFDTSHEARHDHRRVLTVVHHPATPPPAPLDSWQNVATERVHVRQFLLDIFSKPIGDNHKALEPKLRDFASLPAAVEQIVSLFAPAGVSVVKETHYIRFLRIVISEDTLTDLRASGSLPLNTRVTSDQDSLKLFGFGDLPERIVNLEWKDILQFQGSPPRRHFEVWQKDLADSMVAAIDYAPFPTEFGLFRAVQRPGIPEFHYSVLSSLKKFSVANKEHYEIEVIFSPVLDEHDPRPREDRLNLLSQMNTISRYFRWGVCERFLGELERISKTPMPDQREASRLMKELARLVDRLLLQSARAGLLDEEAPLRVIRDENDRVIVRELYRRYRDMWPSFMASFERSDIESCMSGLRALREMNLTFMRMAARYYAEELEHLA